MPYKKSFKQTEAKPILAERRGAKASEYGPYEAKALGKLVMAAIMNGNAVYLQPSRFGTVTFKVYIEGEQFAENFNPGDDWGNLAEEIIDALYDKENVGKTRVLFGDAVGSPQGDEKAPAKGKMPA